jgi:DNA-binding PadR family transcriptional regulator
VGEAKLKRPERMILEILSTSSEEMYGLDIVKTSGGRLARGMIYVHLGSLEERALISSRPEPDKIRRTVARRRLYKITAQGTRALTAALAHSSESKVTRGLWR